MDILVIANGIASFNGKPGISGGDVRFLEIMRRWGDMGHRVHFMSTAAGKELADRFGVNVYQFHELKIKGEAGVKAYAHRVLSSMKLPDSLKNFKGYVYTTTEHMYDSIPAAKLAKKGNPWAGVVHWVSPVPWKRLSPGILNSTLFFLQQRYGIKEIKKHATYSLNVSQPTLDDYLALGGKKDNSFLVECGIDLSWMEENEIPTEFEYDAVFMKRLHPGKGIYDIIEIWGEVVKQKADARLAIMGEGSEDVRNRILSRMKELEIEDNIDLIGPVYDIDEKLKILRSSKVFVLPSHEENWAIVIGEAMAAGLPVVCYDLKPIHPVWEDSIVWSPFKDYKAFADNVVAIATDEEKWKNMRSYGQEFVKKYDWDKIAEKELNILIEGKE